MRYFVKPAGAAEAVAVDIRVVRPGVYELALPDGRVQEIDAHTLEHGAVSLLADGRSFAFEFEEAGNDVLVSTRSHVYRVDVASERQLRMRAASAQFSLEGRQVIYSPMPGKVVKLLAKAGEAVTEGQGLVVVEAMKMENELKSPKSGTLVELHCTEGQTVDGGAKLAVVE